MLLPISVRNSLSDFRDAGGSRQCGFMDFGYSGERRMAVSANCKNPGGGKGGRDWGRAGVRNPGAQEGSKRRNSRVSVVSGTITGTYPLRYPRPYVSSSPSYSSREFVTGASVTLANLGCQIPRQHRLPSTVAEFSH